MWSPQELEFQRMEKHMDEEYERIHKKAMLIGYVLGLVVAAFADYISHVLG
jgi:hypothetical protein